MTTNKSLVSGKSISYVESNDELNNIGITILYSKNYAHTSHIYIQIKCSFPLTIIVGANGCGTSLHSPSIMTYISKSMDISIYPYIISLIALLSTRLAQSDPHCHTFLFRQDDDY